METERASTGAEPGPVALAVSPTDDLVADLLWFVDELGFRLERIVPTDDPDVAELPRHGCGCDSTARSTSPPARCAGECRRPPSTEPCDDETLVSPGGTQVLREREESVADAGGIVRRAPSDGDDASVSRVDPDDGKLTPLNAKKAAPWGRPRALADVISRVRA